jgi:negative regulator of flagellin synthesis FlgM
MAYRTNGGVAMRIDPSFHYPGNVPADGVGNTQGQSKVPSSQVAGGSTSESQLSDSGDTVQFSGNLAEIQQLKAQLAQTPEVRADRVAALQQQIQQGTYNPGNEAIANAMIADFTGSGGQSQT